MTNLDNLKITKELSRPGILLAVARQPQTSRLFCGAADAKVYSFDVLAENPEAGEYHGHESYVTGVAWAGKHLVSCSYDGRLIWWDPETGQQVRAVPAHSRWIRRVCATPDGRFVVSVADDMVCRVWDAERGVLVRDLIGHAARTPHHFPSMLYACAISPDGRLLATGDKVGTNIVWDLANGRRLATLETPTLYTWDPKQRIHSIGGVRSLAFSPDARLLAIGGIGQIENIDHLGGPSRVEVFDWRKGERTHEFSDDEHKGLVQRLAFEPHGQWLLAAGGDNGGFIKFLDLSANKVLRTDKAPMHIHDCLLNEAADTLYAAGHGKAAVWNWTG